MGRFFSNLYPPCIGGLLFLDALVLLDGLGGDGGCGLGAVSRLCVRCGGGDRAPCFARGHAKGEANRNYRYE